MSEFTGRLSLFVVEANDLPAKIPLPGGLFLTSFDPYLSIVVDNDYFGETASQAKTFNPVWQEQVEAFIRKASDVEFIIFHKTPLAEQFVASAKISISDLVAAESDDLRVRIPSRLRSSRMHAAIGAPFSFRLCPEWASVRVYACVNVSSDILFSLLLSCADLAGFGAGWQHPFQGRLQGRER